MLRCCATAPHAREETVACDVQRSGLDRDGRWRQSPAPRPRRGLPGDRRQVWNRVLELSTWTAARDAASCAPQAAEIGADHLSRVRRCAGRLQPAGRTEKKQLGTLRLAPILDAWGSLCGSCRSSIETQ